MKVLENYNLGGISWFKVGGNAKFFVKPSTVEELIKVGRQFSDYTIIGNTSNLLISDDGIDGCVVRLGSGFGKIEQLDGEKLKVGGACLDGTFAMTAQMYGISGMEFLFTIPGTIGGNVVMNAGCFGREIFEVLESVEIFVDGKVEVLKKEEISHGYRYTSLPVGAVVLSAILKGVKSSQEKVKEKMTELMTTRLEAQPSNVRTGGSTFKNPNGTSAWKLTNSFAATAQQN